jgi:predicted nucleic acid-binding protein
VADNVAPVVSNTTPLINLVGVGRLDLLRTLYGTVTIAGVVRDEFEAGKASSDPNLTSLAWIQIVTAKIDASLPQQLGAGE